jgi:SecD/SecF fusion protein
LYEIDTTGLGADQIRGLSNKVISVLQRRVDPNAQLNLIWRPVGNTRIEIQMPRPPKKAIERRKAYDRAVDTVNSMNVGRLELEAALSADARARTERLEELVRGVPERQEGFASLVAAYEAYREVAGGDDLDAEDAARASYEEALAAVMRTSLSRERLTDVLALENATERSEQIGRLKSEYPSYAQVIADVEAEYSEWAGEKAALEDPSDLKRLIRGAGVLEFRILADRDLSAPTMIASQEAALRAKPISDYVQQLQQRGPRPRPGDHFHWFPVDNITDFLNLDAATDLKQVASSGKQIVAEYAGKWYALAHADQRHGLLKDSLQKWKLKSAYFNRDQNGRPAVSFNLDPRGGSQFRKLTGNNINRQLCIMLDDVATSHATIITRIGEHGQITGRFTPQEVEELVKILEAGSLPGRLKEPPLMEKNIGPSLGLTNRTLGMKAAIYGLIVVAVFILIYYTFAGLVADLALFLNLLFVLAVMAFLEATFTLPGIAGLILTVGMAVDANVLIFERIREEREKGTMLKRALKTGYEKALSTIVDANLTTLITCVVLGYVGSEEVKGFAMTLGFGIVTSMFTALFVTRLIFTTLIDKGWLKELRMFKLIGHPNVDWLRLRRAFWPVSLILVVVGLTLFSLASKTDPEKVYDIEFLGGTSVQIELKPDRSLTDDHVRRLVTQTDGEGISAVQWLEQAADALEMAEASLGDTQSQFVLTSDTLTTAQMAALMQTKQRGAKNALVDQLEIGGVTGQGHTCRFDTKPIQVRRQRDDDAEESQIQQERNLTLAEFEQAVTSAVAYARRAAGLLATAKIQTVRELEEEGSTAADAFEIITVESNRQLVQEAILAALGDELAIERPIDFTVATDAAHPEGHYPIEEDAHYLSDVIGGDANFDIRGYKGGVVLVFDQLDPPQTVENISKRIREIRLQPGFERYKWRDYNLLGLTSVGQGAGGEDLYSKVALTVVDEELPYYDDPVRWSEAVAAPELKQASEALRSEKTLRKVIQFAPQIADQTKTQAMIAVAVALAAIVAYVWIRFGTMQFGLAAIVALVHDVAITLGFITLSDYFHGGRVGEWLLIQDFKIDLPMIAAMLTIIGYSLNDTIVVFDRIRENRGKLSTLSPQMINSSINQCLSRTVLTSLTTFVVVAIMYWLGGPGASTGSPMHW